MDVASTIRNSFGKMILGSALALGTAIVPTTAHAAVFVSVGIAPPPIPVYAQPVAPGDGYIWTPGYWAYGPDGYYWVGRCYEASGKKEQAILYYRQALALDKDFTEAADRIKKLR